MNSSQVQQTSKTIPILRRPTLPHQLTRKPNQWNKTRTTSGIHHPFKVNKIESLHGETKGILFFYVSGLLVSIMRRLALCFQCSNTAGFLWVFLQTVLPGALEQFRTDRAIQCKVGVPLIVSLNHAISYSPYSPDL